MKFYGTIEVIMDYMDNNNLKDKQEQEYMPLRIYYILTQLALILLYAIVIFYFDKFLFLFRWIDYGLLSRMVPDIFIPKLGDNGSYEKSIVLGMLTFLVVLLLTTYSFVSWLKILIKYNGEPVDKNNFLIQSQNRIFGNQKSWLRILRNLISAVLFALGCIYMCSRTIMPMKEGGFTIFATYFFIILCTSVSGMYFAEFVYKIIGKYQKLFK